MSTGENDLATIVGPCALDMRLVTPDDAEYIHALRTDPAFNTHLSAVGGGVEAQRTWIEDYKHREKAGSQFYFIIETKSGQRCGLVRIYDITKDNFTWGSWILDRNKPPKAALESAFLIYLFAFEKLGLRRATFEVMRENKRTLAFHHRFGAHKTGEDETNFYFEYDAADFESCKDGFLKTLSPPPPAANDYLSQNPHLVIEDGVTIDHSVVFAPSDGPKTLVRKDAHIGAGAVIGVDLEIGWGANILPGAVVLSSVPANAVASGNPAKIIGYTTEVASENKTLVRSGPLNSRREAEIVPLNVGGAALYEMPMVIDMRGNLTVGEFEDSFPFPPKRYFAVFDVPSEKLRGEHAHYNCHQFLICLSGSCKALIDDGKSRLEVTLDSPDVGLYMPPLIWGTQYQYSRDAVLLVFASHGYDGDDYIRDYDSFRMLTSDE